MLEHSDQLPTVLTNRRQPFAEAQRHSRGLLAHAEAQKLHGTQGEVEQRVAATQRSED